MIFSRTLFAAGALLAAAGASADVGVSLQFSQPGVYGRVDIGQFPQPQLVVPQAVMVMPPPMAVAAPPPVYLWVPPAHRRHWARHCREYHACGRPVYFVQDDWYRRNVMRGAGPGHGGPHHDGGPHHQGGPRGDAGRFHGDDRGRDHDHGPGYGHRHDG